MLKYKKIKIKKKLAKNFGLYLNLNNDPPFTDEKSHLQTPKLIRSRRSFDEMFYGSFSSLNFFHYYSIIIIFKGGIALPIHL